jgi:tetratricopeptide (TPR) repeat protein
MSTLHQFQRNNKATRVRGRSGKVEIADEAANPSKRKAVSAFGRQPTTKVQVKQSREIVDLNKRAIDLYEKGDFNLASNLFLKALAIRNKVIAESGASETELACKSPPPTSSYIYQRFDFDEGMNIYETTQAIQHDDHPTASEATLFFNAGQAKRRLEDYSQSWHYYRHALNVLLPLHKDDHIRVPASARTVHALVIPILHNMGQLAYRQGNVTQAFEFYEAALVHSRSLKGDKDYSVGATMNCLGVLYYHLSADETEKAANCFKEALEILKATNGEDSKAVATTLNNYGRVMVQQEDFDAALVHYELALDIRRRTLGTDDINFAATAFNAGQSLHQQGVFERALTLYREFLRVALKKLPKDHRDIAVVLSAIAQILQEKKEFGEALKLYHESLRVGRAALGNEHAEVAMLLNRLGNFYFEREEFGKALVAYKEGLVIERRVVSLDSSV